MSASPETRIPVSQDDLALDGWLISDFLACGSRKIYSFPEFQGSSGPVDRENILGAVSDRPE